jgi:DNA-binding NarL/FixJ family response regulator
MKSTLLVEDDLTMRAWLRRALLEQMPDLHIHEAEDCNQALEKYKHHRPDVVVMDINLPGGKNGLETAREIRKMNLPVEIMFLTNYGEPEFVQAAKALGSDFFLVKSDARTNQFVCCVCSLLKRSCNTLMWAKKQSHVHSHSGNG